MAPLPYCGTPPLPAELAARFNWDPILIALLVVFATVHVATAGDRRGRIYAALGWLTVTAAFVSPLCALSVALFSARVLQHMILLLVAAPLIALAGPKPRDCDPSWVTGGAFALALWVWHMPTPYDATFASTSLYWTMHVTLFGTGIALWRELVHHSARKTALALTVGLLTSMQMGLLGAVLTFARHPLFFPHLTTTRVWGLTPLQDQQLGGTLMWVPGIVLFLWVTLRSLRRLWNTLEGTSQHESPTVRLP